MYNQLLDQKNWQNLSGKKDRVRNSNSEKRLSTRLSTTTTGPHITTHFATTSLRCPSLQNVDGSHSAVHITFSQTSAPISCPVGFQTARCCIPAKHRRWSSFSELASDLVICMALMPSLLVGRKNHSFFFRMHRHTLLQNGQHACGSPRKRTRAPPCAGSSPQPK